MSLRTVSLLYGIFQGRILWNRWDSEPAQEERRKRITRLAKEMGYNFPLAVRESKEGPGMAFGSRFSILPSLVVINPDSPEEEFTSAHEIAHLHKEHYLQSMALVMGATSLWRPRRGYMLALAAPVVYAAVVGLQRIHEKEADLIACRYVSQQGIGRMLHRFNAPLWVDEPEWSRTHPKVTDRLAYLKEEFYKKGEPPLITFNNQDLPSETSHSIREKIKQSSREISLIDASNIELGEDHLKVTTFSGTSTILPLKTIASDVVKMVEEGLKSPRFLSLSIETTDDFTVHMETLRGQFRSQIPHAERFDFDKMEIILTDKKNNYNVRIPYEVNSK